MTRALRIRKKILGRSAALSPSFGYGVRIAVDAGELDPPPPSDPRELAALLDVEERLGATDPYRWLGQLAHLVLCRTPAPTADGV